MLSFIMCVAIMSTPRHYYIVSDNKKEDVLRQGSCHKRAGLKKKVTETLRRGYIGCYGKNCWLAQVLWSQKKLVLNTLYGKHIRLCRDFVGAIL